MLEHVQDAGSCGIYNQSQSLQLESHQDQNLLNQIHETDHNNSNLDSHSVNTCHVKPALILKTSNPKPEHRAWSEFLPRPDTNRLSSL